MRIGLFLIILLINSAFLHAQNPQHISWNWLNQENTNNPFEYSGKVLLGIDSQQIVKNATSFLNDEFSGLISPKSGVLPIFYRTTSYGQYLTLCQTINHKPVYGTELKFSLSNKGVISSTYFTYINGAKPTSDTLIWGLNKNVDAKPVYIYIHDSLIAALKYQQNSKLCFQITKNRMISRELGINKGELKDTTIWVKVFNPDPLTTAKRQYGSNYRNFKDSNNSYLNQQMQWKSIDAEVRSDTFWLSSKWVKLLYNGKEPITSINSDSIEVTRDHWQFEYLMIYYHLKKYRDFLESIGFEQMANYPVKANPHAYTYDNSKFIPRLDGSGSGLLNFGYCKDSCGTSIANECHVDDAEDADVIIHEYGHALSFSVNGNETSRTPRKAIDEGLSDFITCAYSKKIGEFESDYIFNWDGRNEFWDGRKCFTSRTVNDYKTGRYVEHYNGEIFAGALSEIALKIGYDETHKILFESMYSYSERMKFTDAALLFLDAEQRVYKAENAQTVCSIFAKYNFVSDSFCMVSMADKPNTKFYAINKRAFFENGSIVLQLNTPYITRLKLYDATGKLAYSSELNNQATIIESLQLAKGTYVLVLENQSRIFTEKMVR